MRVLPVNVHEPLAQFLHLRHSDRRAVDPAARAALDVHRAAQKQYAVFACEFRGFKPGGGSGRCAEFRGHFCALGSFTDHARVASRPENEFQGINENRFARARFTGQAGKARLGFNRERADDHKVFQ